MRRRQSGREVIITAEMQRSKSLSRFSSCRPHTQSQLKGLGVLVAPLKGAQVNFNLTFIEQNSFIFINAPTTQRRKQETNINKCPSEESERERESKRNTGTINKSVAIIKKNRQNHKYKCSKEPQNKHKIHTAAPS